MSRIRSANGRLRSRSMHSDACQRLRLGVIDRAGRFKSLHDLKSVYYRRRYVYVPRRAASRARARGHARTCAVQHARGIVYDYDGPQRLSLRAGSYVQAGRVAQIGHCQAYLVGSAAACSSTAAGARQPQRVRRKRLIVVDQCGQLHRSHSCAGAPGVCWIFGGRCRISRF
eukprot:COSAG02_NODE_6648_length_3437_cov_1.548232_5_plen_171_part_00